MNWWGPATRRTDAIMIALSFLTLVVASLTLWVAQTQLSEANRALRAGNALALTRESREVAERIVLAFDDPTALRLAFGRYGQHIASAGYLHDRGQIDRQVWQSILHGFCDTLGSDSFGQAFGTWYTEMLNESQFTDLYPRFNKLRSGDAGC
jgi:hypothetical protein